MPVHTDILDNLLFLAAPLVLALGVFWPRLGGRFGAMVGMALVGLLLVDITEQLPFPAAFPGGDPPVSDVVTGLWWVSIWSLVAVMVAPRPASWLLACLLAAPALSIVVFTANAVAACNPYAHHDGILREALARAGEQTATLGLLAAVVYAASDERRGFFWMFLRSVVSAALAAGVFWWGAGGGRELMVVGVAALLPWAPLFPWPRQGFATWVTLSLRWARVAWLAGGALVGVLLLGVMAHFGWLPKPLLGDHSGTGGVRVGGGGFLPMTGVYFLFPLLLCALANVSRPRLLPWIPARWQVLPGWAVIGGAAAAVTTLALLVQGETGLSTLVLVAVTMWWLAVSGRVRQTLVALGFIAVLVFLGVLVMYRSPVLLGAASGTLGRLSWLVLGYDDGRAHQGYAAWQFFRDVGWWGTGVRDPGGPLNVPAWTNDFLSMSAARFLGICGAVGIVAAALLPACVASRGAASEVFDAEADLARPAAMFTVPWAVLWGGGAVWVSAGAMGIFPLSGLTMGLASPALNHLLWTLPAVAWVAARSSSRGQPSRVPMAGLRLASHLTWVGVVVVAGVVLTLGWQHLADQDEAWVLPFEMSGTLRVTASGDTVWVEKGDDVSGYVSGETFTIEQALLRVVAGPSVEVAGVHIDAKALARGFHFGLAGRHAPIHPGAPLVGDRIALFNDVWLEADAPTRWRELTIRRAGPQVFAIAPVGGSAIEVISLDGGVCTASKAGDKCPLDDRARIAVRDAYSFVVHVRGSDLDLDWLDGRPEARLVPRGHGLLLGDRTLAPREGSDQMWVREARAELGLLGEVGVLYVADGTLRVREEENAAPVDGKESESAVSAAAEVARRVWLTRSTRCRYGWAWANLRDPLAGGPCVDGGYGDSLPPPEYLGRIVQDQDGRVVSIRPRTKILETLSQAEARSARGMIRDRYGSPLFTWKEDYGWVAVEPWLEWLGEREMSDAPVKAGHPELGTRTTTRSSGLQKEFHRALTGRYGPESPWVELWRRIRLDARPRGVDVYTTLSLPLMRVAAGAAADEAGRLAEAARSMGPARQEAERRDCRAWDVNLVITDQGGAILAAVTAVGVIGVDGAVSVVWETGAKQVGCLKDFDGALRALAEPVMPGSTQKVWDYALAAELAHQGEPYIQFEERDGDLWLQDRGDVDNGDGHYILDPGDLERVYGQNVPDCHNHGGGGAAGPIRFVDAFARSGNAAACFLASAASLGGDRIGPVMRALQLDGPVDVLLPLGDPDLDRSRIPVGTFAVGGQVATLADGTVTLSEATKMPLGKGVGPTTLGLTGAVRMVGNGGVYTPPYLLLGVRLADGSERRITPPPPIRVVSPFSAGWVEAAMRAVVSTPGGTGYSAMRGLSPVRLSALGLKTGTADLTTEVNGRQVPLPSPKSAVALYPLGSSSPVSIAVWTRHAQHLDDQAALRVVRAVIESGALDSSVAAR